MIHADRDAIVQGQEARVHQVIVNVVENTLETVRGRPDAKVSIGVKLNPDTAEVRVQDNGPGVTQAVADKIFEPFVATKTVGEGTGLGLWISHSIAREHGGKIALMPSDSGAVAPMRTTTALSDPLPWMMSPITSAWRPPGGSSRKRGLGLADGVPSIATSQAAVCLVVALPEIAHGRDNGKTHLIST